MVRDFLRNNLNNFILDTLDLLIVLDLSSNKPRISERLKKVAIDLLKQIPAKDYYERVRVALISQNQKAQIKSLTLLDKNTLQDDILFAIDRIESGGGKFALDKGIKYIK